MNRYRSGARRFVSSWILLAIGCASDPAARTTGNAPTGASADAPSAVFASIDEAAVAALSDAHSRVRAATRQSLQVGTIREVKGGYSWSEPRIADSWIQANPPPVVRVRLATEDVATYVVHPVSGDSNVDRANESLNGSEKKLLGGGGARPRPVYLLTPSLAVVRHEIGGTPYPVAELGVAPRGARAAIRTADRE